MILYEKQWNKAILHKYPYDFWIAVLRENEDGTLAGAWAEYREDSPYYLWKDTFEESDFCETANKLLSGIKYGSSIDYAKAELATLVALEKLDDIREWFPEFCDDDDEEE